MALLPLSKPKQHCSSQSPNLIHSLAQSKSKQTKQPKYLWKSQVWHGVSKPNICVLRDLMDKSRYLLWSLKKMLRFEEFWEVSVIVIKNLQVPYVMMERFCKDKQNYHHKGLNFTHQIIHRFKIFKSILVELTWNTMCLQPWQ